MKYPTRQLLPIGIWFANKVGKPLLEDLYVSFWCQLERRRGNMLHLRNVRAGTVLICALAKGTTHHSGIYLGRGQVAELFGDGRYLKVSLDKFIHGAEGENLRSGFYAYAACDADGKPLGSPEVAECARRLVGSTTDYKLDANNCHLFSATCHANGEIQKISGLKRVIKTFSIGKLCRQIQTFHNTKTLRWLR